MFTRVSTVFGLAMAGLVQIASPAKAQASPVAPAELQFDKITGGKSKIDESVTGKSPVYPARASFVIVSGGQKHFVWKTVLCSDLTMNGTERAIKDLTGEIDFDKVSPSIIPTIKTAVDSAMEACKPQI